MKFKILDCAQTYPTLKSDVIYGCPPSHGSHDKNHDGDIGRRELVFAVKEKGERKKQVCIVSIEREVSSLLSQ